MLKAAAVKLVELINSLFSLSAPFASLADSQLRRADVFLYVERRREQKNMSNVSMIMH
jgi:hypothetical protein